MEFAKTFMDDGIYRFFVYIYVIELTRACMGSVLFSFYIYQLICQIIDLKRCVK